MQAGWQWSDNQKVLIKKRTVVKSNFYTQRKYLPKMKEKQEFIRQTEIEFTAGKSTVQKTFIEVSQTKGA